MSLEWWDTAGVIYLARFFIVVLFPFSTLDKIFNYKGALAQANSSFVPGGPLLLLVGGIVEIGCSFSILVGWHDRLGAFILAGYCAATALLFHNFWAYGDFWKPGASAGREHFWEFLKNFGLVGGLMLLVLLSDLLPVSAVMAHPLSSAPLAATAQEVH